MLNNQRITEAMLSAPASLAGDGSVKMCIRDRYCGKKLFPVEPDTTAHNLPHKCRACKHELKVNIPPEPRAFEPSAD